jgi:hypothetical protein
LAALAVAATAFVSLNAAGPPVMQPTIVMLFASEVLVADGCGRPLLPGLWIEVGGWVGAVGASGFPGAAGCWAAVVTPKASATKHVETMPRISSSLLLSRVMAAVHARSSARLDPADR